MTIKKSELYASLCNSRGDSRDGTDAKQYGIYALVLLFVRHVSNKAASQTNYQLNHITDDSAPELVMHGYLDARRAISQPHRLPQTKQATALYRSELRRTRSGGATLTITRIALASRSTSVVCSK